MTNQITDKVLYGGQEYDLVGISNKENFLDVDTLGIRTEAFTTDNHRGRTFRFAIKKEQLLVKDLAAKTEQEIPVNGVLPYEISVSEQLEELGTIFTRLGSLALQGDKYYFDVELPVEYTGQLLLATDFIHEYYIHGGFNSALKYEKVLLLTIVDGLVLEMRDVSASIEAERERLLTSGIDITDIIGDLSERDIFKMLNTGRR